jgi:phosphate butyryltransferase
MTGGSPKPACPDLQPKDSMLMITRVEEILAIARDTTPSPRIVLAGSENASALETTVRAHHEGFAEAVLVGDPDKTRALAEEQSLDISDIELIDRFSAADCVATALERIHAGQADILVKGYISTQVMLKGVLDRSYGFRTDRALSHISVFNIPEEQRVLIITDAGVNVQPDLSRKRDILLNAVDMAHALDMERPKVAVMSFVEGKADSRIGSQADAHALRELYLDGKIPGCVVEGPYSFDVALSREAAEIKGITGEVAGQADIIVMNDLGMGNILYKALLLWVKPMLAAVVMGANIPLVVPSRADSIQTKLNSVALATVVLKHLRATNA